jgi:sarcosine oxidase subunit alpha
MSTKKDFIGRVMAARPGLTDPERPALIGIKPLERKDRLRSGAHFLPNGVSASAANDEGYVTSVAYSPTLKHWIGLGFLKRGALRLGERIRVYDPLHGSDAPAEVCPPTFVDPTGERLHS